jgi:hypothetical protein
MLGWHFLLVLMKYIEDNFEDPSLALLGRTEKSERFRKRLLWRMREKIGL